MTQVVQLLLCLVIGYAIGKWTGDAKKGFLWGGILLLINIIYIMIL